MSKKVLNAQEYDTLIDTFAQKLWLARELWLGIKEVRKQIKECSIVRTEYPVFFDSVYRSFVHEFYNGIYRLVDETKQVESLVKLLKKRSTDKPKIEKEEWAEKLVILERALVEGIKNNSTIKKIKAYRDNVMCHQNSRMIFDTEFSKEFLKQNDKTPDEIESLLNSLGEILKKAAIRATFSPLTLPNTPIRSEIRKIFSVLSQELKIPCDHSAGETAEKCLADN